MTVEKSGPDGDATLGEAEASFFDCDSQHMVEIRLICGHSASLNGPSILVIGWSSGQSESSARIGTRTDSFAVESTMVVRVLATPNLSFNSVARR